MTGPSDLPPPAPPAPSDTPDELQKALPLALELPATVPVPVGDARALRARTTATPATGRPVLVRVIITVVALAALAAVGVALWLPGWIRQQFIDAAAARGIALAIDDAKIDSTGFRLLGLRASTAELPGSSLAAAELDVETSGLRPTKLTVRGATLKLDGPWSTVDAALTRWRTSAGPGQGGDTTPSTLVVDESHVAWTHAIGDNGRIEAANVHLDVASHGSATEVHARSDKVTVGVPGGALGPWRVDFDRAPGSTRARVALDPSVPDACTVLVIGDDDKVSQVDVVVPRSPPGRIGLSPAILGLRGKDLQVGATVHYTDLGPGRSEATATGGVYSIEVAGLPRPLDVAWEASASGDPRQGMTLKKSRLAAGPLVGALEGTLRSFEDGFRIDLGWVARPVPCTAFDAPLGDGQPFDIAYQLRKLVQAAGIAKVAGDVSARGTAALDSRDLGSTQVQFFPQVSCQVALFGP